MVVKPRLLLAIASALSLTVVAAAPGAASFKEADPAPLRKEPRLNVRDISTGSGSVVAVGWREGSGAGQLYLAFSTDSGRTYFRPNNDNLRKFKVVGDSRLGLSLDVCAGRVWAASSYRNPSDRVGDSDVILTTRTIGGGADQRFMTQSSVKRKVRDVQVECIGQDLIAVAWLEQSGGASRAKMLIRSTEALSKAPAFQKLFKLGTGARYQDGIALAGTPEAVHVVWGKGNKRNLRMKRFLISGGDTPVVTPQEASTIAFKDARFPQLAARGQNLALAYSHGGKVKVKRSNDLGASWSGGTRVMGAGSVSKPSKPYSVDVSGDRIVVEAGANKNGQFLPRRVQSLDGGSSWNVREYGHKGVRVGALLNRNEKPPLLMEAWHNNDAVATDTLRAQFEKL